MWKMGVSVEVGFRAWGLRSKVPLKFKVLKNTRRVRFKQGTRAA